MAEPPRLYFDLASPYAYLAVARVAAVFPEPVELEPVLLGAIFQRRGWGSWAETHERDERVADVEARAERYGLPRMVWPRVWPMNSLAADRAATWAKQQGGLDAFARELYRREFAEGADITDPGLLATVASDTGLDPDELLRAIQQQPLKDALRKATDDAWEAGVEGVPSIRVGDKVFFGDDQLEEAAAYADPRLSR